MMDIRKRIYITASALVALVIVFLLVFLLLRDRTPSNQETGQTPTSTNQQTGSPVNTGSPNGVDMTTPSTPTLPPEDNYVRQLARIFVERYGSYSNQNDNSHIEDVLPIVTNSMASWLRTQSVSQQGDYQGITTNVIVSTIESISESNASVHVEVQESIETRTTRETNYRTGTVTLVFQSGAWKVDGLFWDN